ncbi:MAG: DUF3343 domain-containing protein [Firmicutes bacterium]|nr:DUF3343 domain-containing protein [Bacillota bacterium]
MKKEVKAYVLFPSHTDGLKLEKVLKERKIKYTITPTPRSLSKSCGIAIMIDPNDIKEIENILELNPKIKTEGIHKLEKRKRVT